MNTAIITFQMYVHLGAIFVAHTNCYYTSSLHLPYMLAVSQSPHTDSHTTPTTRLFSSKRRSSEQRCLPKTVMILVSHFNHAFGLFCVNEKLLTQHISGPGASISCCMSATRVGQGLRLGLGLRVRGVRDRARARARHCHLLSKISGPFTSQTDLLLTLHHHLTNNILSK